MSVEPRSPVERDIIEMSLESVKKGGNQHIVRKDDDDEKLGLLNIRAFFFLILWYIFSAFTLFLNKYILTTLKGDPAVLGAMQMVMTTICGFIQLYIPMGFYKPVKRDGKPPNFWRNMILVGSMRLSTVLSILHCGAWSSRSEVCRCVLHRDCQEFCPFVHCFHLPSADWGVHRFLHFLVTHSNHGRTGSLFSV